MALPRLFDSRIQRVAIALSLIACGAVGFLPLFGGFTYEFGLFVGLAVPSIVAVAMALEIVVTAPLPAACAMRGVVVGAVHVACVCLVALLHGLRVGFCELGGQVLLFALSPLPGILLGGLWGSLAGIAAMASGSGRFNRVQAVVLAISGPLLGVVVSFLRYYQSPIIFAFDPFVGYFAGTLYDTELDGVRRLVTYRIGSLGMGAFLVGIAFTLSRDQAGQLRFRPRQHLPHVVLALVGASASLGITLSGQQLGHFQTAASIRETLGHVAVSERCEVVYQSGIIKRDAHALARECDAHIAALEAYFDTKTAPKTTVFLFASAAQKAELMGARDVYIAKPWRHEIYIQARGYPHPVLGHELAHVVAGSFAKGPFKIAGPLGGWIPDPGRIEGYAEAAAMREDEDLSPFEWAKAMRDLEMLPPLERIFRLSFLGENASKAYTVAGAFVGWMKERYGSKALHAWYAGSTLEEATGKGLVDLESEFHTALDQVKLQDAVMAIAKGRFDRPAVFGRQCPHQVDEVYQRAGAALGRLDPDQAKEFYDRVLDLDAEHFGARAGLANCALREGNLDASKKAFLELSSDESLPLASRKGALERVADIEILQGQIAQAGKLYDEVAKGQLDEDALRNLDVKRWINEKMDPENPARRAITALLIGDPELGSDWGEIGAELGRWSVVEPKLGLADYLLGKNYFNRGRWDLGAKHLDEALARDLPLPRVKREAQRTRLLVACALGQKGRAKQVLDQLKDDKGGSPRRREGIQRFAARCGIPLD